MLIATFICSVINLFIMGYFLIREFKDTYTIVKKEVYDAMADYYLQYHDEQGNELTHELAGGTGTPYYGFFQDYIPDDGEEEEENE